MMVDYDHLEVLHSRKCFTEAQWQGYNISLDILQEWNWLNNNSYKQNMIFTFIYLPTKISHRKSAMNHQVTKL